MFAERGATLGFKRVGVSGLFYSEARMSVWFLLYGAMVLGLKQQVLLRVGHCHVTVPVLIKDTQTAIVQLVRQQLVEQTKDVGLSGEGELVYSCVD
jgi:hypothetical protein